MLSSTNRRHRIRPSALLVGSLIVLTVLIGSAAPAIPTMQAAQISDAQAMAMIASSPNPLFGSDDFEVFDPAGATFDAFEPATAYDPINNRYLVVFSTERIVTTPQSGIDNGEDEFEVYGQFIDGTSGAAQGAPFRISYSGNDDTCNVVDNTDAFSPDVAYAPPGTYGDPNNPTNWTGGFMVAWVADGLNPLKDPNDCNSGRAGYLDNNAYEVYIQLLDAAGNPLLNNDAGNPEDVLLSELEVARHNNDISGYPGTPEWDAYSPAVAFNPIDGDYMICWSDDRSAFDGSGSITGGAYEIRCKRFQLAPGQGNTAPYLGITPSGQPYQVSDAGNNAADLNYDAYMPDVAFSTEEREWLVVWSGDDDRSAAMTDNEYEIWGERLLPNGTRVANSDDQRLSRMGTNASRSADAYRPALAYNPDRNQFLLVWHGDDISDGSNGSPATINDEEEIYGALLRYTGSGTERELTATGETRKFRISVQGPSGVSNGAADYDARDPDVVYSPATREWLVSWRGNNAGNVNQFLMYAQRIDADILDDTNLNPNPNNGATPPPAAFVGPTLQLGSAAVPDAGFYRGSQIGEALPTGDPQPANDVVGVPTNYHRHGAKIAVTPTGDALVAWAGFNIANDVEVRARLLILNAAPVLTTPAGGITVEPIDPNGATVDYADQVSANDAEDGPLSVNCTPASGSLFAVGTTAVTCSTEADSGGKTDSATFNVTVNSDLTAPTLSLPDGPLVVEASGTTTEVGFAASASDNIDLNVDVVCTPAAGSGFALGTTAVECVATDDFGNQATGSFDVEVIDTTAPVIDVPVGGIATKAPDENGAVVEFTISAGDLVDGTLSTTCEPASGSLFPVGATTVTCSAEDAAGNSASATFSVTVAEPDARADLALSISLPDEPVIVGEQLTVSLTLRNNGPNDASGVVLSMPLPEGLSFVSGGPNPCALENGQVRCAVGALAANTQTSLQVRLAVMDDAAASINLSASVTAAEEDPASGNNSTAGTIATEVPPAPAPEGLTIYLPILFR